MTDKEVVRDVLDGLPEGATFEEIVEEIQIMAAVKQGRADVAAGRLKSHGEVGQLIQSWAATWTTK